MTTNIFTRHGGRQQRYRESRGEITELFDPWEGRRLAFLRRYADFLWLMLRAKPDVLTIRVDSKAEPLLPHSRLRPEMVVVGTDGRETFEFLSFNGVHHARLHDALADWTQKDREVRCRLTSRPDLNTNSTLIANMAHARRLLTLYHGMPLDALTERVAGLFQQHRSKHANWRALPAMRLGELHSRATEQFGPHLRQPLVAVLFRLRQAYVLDFGLQEPLGEQTLITGLPSGQLRRSAYEAELRRQAISYPQLPLRDTN